MSMSRRSDEVKVARTYNAASRREKARQHREATLAVARDQFLADGYVATTVESIATTAGVSPATIYKTYGGKSGLVRSLCQDALLGDDPTPAEDRSDALRSNTNPRDVIAGWGALRAEVAPRIAPLLLLLRDAAREDAEAAALYDELDRARVRRMTYNATYLVKGGHVRAGVSAKEARDVLWLSSAPELYDLLVNRRRWSIARYTAFVDTMVAGAVL